MTLKEKASEIMFERGMFREQGEQAFEILIADPANEVMKGRWNDQAEDYPQALMSVLLLAINRAALLWIDMNLPCAWYRPLFENDSEALDINKLKVQQ